MEIRASEWIEFARIIKALISENIWAIVSLFFLYLTRDGVRELVKRVVNLDFSWGQAKGSIKAEPLPPVVDIQNKVAVKEEIHIEDNSTQPSEESEKGDWFSNVYDFLKAGQKEEAKKALDEYLSSVTDLIERFRSRSLYLHFSYTMTADKSALEMHACLFKEAETPEQKEAVAFWLCYSYREARNFLAERQIWEAMLNLDTTDDKTASFIVNLSSCLEAEKKLNEAVLVVETAISTMSNHVALGQLFKKLGSLQAEGGNKLLAAVAYEKALEYLPDDKDVLFSAAYAQSNTDLPYLAYFNYDTLTSLHPESDVGYNNMGVQASNLGMQGRSVRYYREAIERNNTLSMANLAYLYIAKGFYHEAKELLQQALAHNEPHQNVSSALSELEKKKQEETDINKKALDCAMKQRDFLRLFGESRFTKTMGTQNINGFWRVEKNAEIEFTLKEEKLVCAWEEPVGMNSSTKRKCNFSASLTNATLTGRYTEEGNSSYTVLGYEPTRTRDFIAYFPDQLTLSLMFVDKEEPMFKSFLKITDATPPC